MGKVINTHLHLGGSYMTPSDYSEEQLLACMEKNNLDGIMALPIGDPKPEAKAVHDRIYAFSKRAPAGKKIWGVCDIHPRCSEEEYRAEAKRCVEELGFVALKLNTVLEGGNILSSTSDKVFKVANELHVPAMVHFALGITTSPMVILKKAKQYPDLKIVICHAGMIDKSMEAQLAAEMCHNVYLECSWTPVHHAARMIKAVGADRVLWGSDGIPATEVDLFAARVMNVTEEERDLFLGGTAMQLYNLEF